MLIYGKEVREALKKSIEEDSRKMKMNLAIMQIGNDQPSLVYSKNIAKFADEIGVGCQHINLKADITEDELLKQIEEINKNEEINGVIIQKPLPTHLNANRISNHLSPTKDVEGIHYFNLGKIISREAGVRPSTPKAIIRLLDYHKIPLEGQKVVIIGRSIILGNPLAMMMAAENATITLCHSKTRNLKAETLQADIIVAALGRKDFITADMVSSEAVIIDAGINYDENGKLFGDVHEEARAKAKHASPVPGGVGVVTVAELFDNLRILVKAQREQVYS